MFNWVILQAELRQYLNSNANIIIPVCKLCLNMILKPLFINRRYIFSKVDHISVINTTNNHFLIFYCVDNLFLVFGSFGAKKICTDYISMKKQGHAWENFNLRYNTILCCSFLMFLYHLLDYQRLFLRPSSKNIKSKSKCFQYIGHYQ